MKSLRIWFFALAFAVFGPATYVAQEPESLRSDWLGHDYKSIELISLLSSPTPLTVQRIKDILGVGDSGDEEDLGFDATTFYIRKGSGYTSFEVEGFVFKGNIGFYKIGIHASPEAWARIRERVIELWKQNHGPDFKEINNGLVHTSTNETVMQGYKSAVSAELGQMKPADVPAELKEFFDYLTSPHNIAFGETDGEIAIDRLVNAERVDLIENVLKGFSLSGRVYAARALLKLNTENKLALSADVIKTIEKVRNLNVSITRVAGCIVSHRTASEILSELDEPEDKSENRNPT